MKDTSRYTVKVISNLAGVSVRTLHYYDEIGLFKPTTIGKNNYRYYDDLSLFRLQQILFYREISLDLAGIKRILLDRNFDLVTALQAHRMTLLEKVDRLNTLVQTVDATILHLIGEASMNRKKIFNGFSEEKQKRYEKEATKRWGDTVKDSVKLWNSYSEEKKHQILEEGSDIYNGIAQCMGLGPDSPKIQGLLAMWHEHLRNFYEPSIDTLRGPGEMYADHPDFNATLRRSIPTCPVF